LNPIEAPPVVPTSGGAFLRLPRRCHQYDFAAPNCTVDTGFVLSPVVM
jgi:hypothetical protein